MENVFQDMPIADRLSHLEANATSMDVEDIKRFFKPEEIVDMKDEVATISILRKDKVDEFKIVKKTHMDSVKGLTTSIDENLKNIKKGYIVENQRVFYFANHETGKMITYNISGEALSERKLRPSEKQTKVVDFDFKKTGTNG
jgi:D-alanine-D-alanine ligase-like ATP-grasp enzyme